MRQTPLFRRPVRKVLVCPVLVKVSKLSALWPRRLILAGGVCDQRGQGSRIMVLSSSLSTPTTGIDQFGHNRKIRYKNNLILPAKVSHWLCKRCPRQQPLESHTFYLSFFKVWDFDKNEIPHTVVELFQAKKAKVWDFSTVRLGLGAMGKISQYKPKHDIIMDDSPWLDLICSYR